MRRAKTQWTLDERARWLAELARAIDEAQQLVWRVSLLRGDSLRSSELYGRLEAARDEVGRLQRSANRQNRFDVDRDWSELMAGVSACAGALD